MSTSDAGLTVDGFLGGRVEALQPAQGHHRSGLEAVLLGAALPTNARGLAVDLGAGAGVAGFCAAWRCPALQVELAERDPDLVAAARHALERPANEGIARRARVRGIDIFATEHERLAAGLQRERADFVLCNPPFGDPGKGSASPAEARRAAHVLAGDLDAWIGVANWLLRPGGTLVLVILASSIANALAAFDRRFGALAILPVHPRPQRPAERVLLRAIKGRRTAPSILPGLILHGSSGSAYSSDVQSVLRDGAGLDDIHPTWQSAGSTPSHTSNGR